MTLEGGRRRWVGEARAKVNLLLRILQREPSGYHRIETIFQALELADSVEIEVHERGVEEAAHDERPRANGESWSGSVADGSPPSISLEVRGVTPGELGPPDKNLAYRAASRFREELLSRGLPLPPFAIRLEKRIPHGAGLGGGSSDAAAVLRGVNFLAGEPLSPSDLLGIAGELGSDVPFFLCGSPRALGEGRGERLTPLSPLPQREVLLLIPAEGIATGWAYGVLAEDRQRTGGQSTSAPSTIGAAVRDSVGAGAGGAMARSDGGRGEWGESGLARISVAEWEEIASVAANDFESVLFPRRPELGAMKELLLRHGASPALLSGSGSVLFGVFSGPEALEAAEEKASAMGVGSLRTRTAMATSTS